MQNKKTSPLNPITQKYFRLCPDVLYANKCGVGWQRENGFKRGGRVQVSIFRTKFKKKGKEIPIFTLAGKTNYTIIYF